MHVIAIYMQKVFHLWDINSITKEHIYAIQGLCSMQIRPINYLYKICSSHGLYGQDSSYYIFSHTQNILPPHLENICHKYHTTNSFNSPLPSSLSPLQGHTSTYLLNNPSGDPLFTKAFTCKNNDHL